MTIAGLVTRGKALAEAIPRDVLIVIILLLASGASFGLGILAGRDMGQGSDFSITQVPMTGAAAVSTATAIPAEAPASIPAGGEVVASRNGTKYFLPWCGGAKLISDANKITFASKEAAEAKGYQPAANCKGL